MLNVRVTPDRPLPGVTLFHNPTADDRLAKGGDYWARSVGFAAAVLAEPGTRLYVHCKAGMHRSAGTVYAILRAAGHSPAEAWDLIATARPKVRPSYVHDVDRHASEKPGHGP